MSACVTCQRSYRIPEQSCAGVIFSLFPTLFFQMVMSSVCGPLRWITNIFVWCLRGELTPLATTSNSSLYSIPRVDEIPKRKSLWESITFLGRFESLRERRIPPALCKENTRTQWRSHAEWRRDSLIASILIVVSQQSRQHLSSSAL